MHMAIINFVNNVLIAGTTANPGLEDVLDPTGLITQNTGILFEITNTAGGQFNNFKFQLSGVGFTYDGTTPIGGTINAITVVAPNGTTHIIEVSGSLGTTSLVSFFNALTSGDTASQGVFAALDALLNSTNTVNGSGVVDHATAFGFGSNDNSIFGNGGDDILWGRDNNGGSTLLVGNAGNDTIRVEDGFYNVAGANQDGTGGAGQINTLEVWGSGGDDVFASFGTITNINALRFVDSDPPVAPDVLAPYLNVYLDTTQIGNGLVSLTLAVDGSSTASPLSSNYIEVSRNFGPGDTTPVNLNLSGWTFTNWNQDRNGVGIRTNPTVALNDTIVGTSVADSISTYSGNDTIQGGGGADDLYGGDGNDTFIYAANEAVEGEYVDGGGGGMLSLSAAISESGGKADPYTDTVRVLGDNNFTGVRFSNIDQLAFGGAATATFDQYFIENNKATVIGDVNANALLFQLVSYGGETPAIDLSKVTFQSWKGKSDSITILGTDVHDAITGSKKDDVINGMGGSDTLQGKGGKDDFVFDTPFRKGVDHIVDFNRKKDDIHLDNDIFKKLDLGKLDKSEFGYGTRATNADQRIIYDQDTGILRYDKDGFGGARARTIVDLDNDAILNAGDIFVI